MIVAVSAPELEYTGNFGWISDGAEGWDLSPDTMKLSWVDIKIDKSLDTMYYVTLQKYSCGRTYEDAANRAKNFSYAVSSRDSILDIGSGFAIYKNDKFRGQRVLLTIKVPVGKKIRFDETVRRKLNPGSIKYTERRRRNNIEFVFNDNASFWWRSDKDYIMQDNGELKDTSGKTIQANRRDYYYDDSDNDRNNNGNDGYRYEQDPKNPSVDQELEKEKRRKEQLEKDKEESDRRIKELEKKQKETQVPANGHTKIKTNGDRAVAKNDTHVLSLAETFF
jgi:hypothetical protein